MKTLQLLAGKPKTIPASTSWYIADLAEARGRQASYTRQSAQRLRALREQALIESAMASNWIESIEIDRKREGTIFFGKPLQRDRDGEEIRGYRRALELIIEEGTKLPVSTDTLLQLHSLACGKTVDAEPPASINELDELLAMWSRSLEERWAHPLIILAMFNLNFLCVHPFRECNDRVSRLLLLLQSFHLGYDVGRYISLERLIEQSQDRYRETLEQSSRRWRKGRHNPWPYIDYLLSILKAAYTELENRLDVAKSPRGAKTELIEAAVKAFPCEFTIMELKKACSKASHDMVRKVLRDLREAGAVESLGRGPGARWRKKDNIKVNAIENALGGEVS